MRVSESKARGAEQLSKIDSLKGHEQELLIEARRLEHHFASNRVEKQRHEAGDM